MKQLYCLFFLIGIALAGMAQKPLQRVHYTIQATLRTADKSIDGQWDAVYVNHADTALHSIWICLYPNAFASDKTHYSEDLLRWGNTAYYFANQDKRGWIDSLNFTVDGSSIVLDKKKENPELVRLVLDQPLPPGDSVHIATTFFTRLPYRFEKEGYDERGFVLQAWCPLVAAFDSNGWHLQPYSLYLPNETANATFSVKINTPKGYSVGTNGVQKRMDEFQYEGPDGFKWVASQDRGFVQNYNGQKDNQDSTRTIIARKIFPEVFHSGRTPEQPAQWVGQVYKTFRRPVPFLADSVYWNESTVGRNTRKLKLGFLYDSRHTDQYRYLFLSPAVGFNNYDKWMVGALVHNYQLPQEPFSFALAPMYATGSKRFAGWGQMAYHIWQPRAHWQFGLAGSTFSMYDVAIPDYPRLYQRTWRMVPSVHLTLLAKDAAATRKWDVGIRSFVISEQDYRLFTKGTDSSYANVSANRTLFQLSTQLQDTRKLYPYSVSAVADAGRDFIRLGLTGKYFFNYDATSQGVSARVFAGKFFYLKSQTAMVEYSNQQYNFTLSGPSGGYDYTYSGYFVGRNETSGWMAQQMMERDGFFKILTANLAGFSVGLSDNWLSALNLAADIPDNYNFLKSFNGTVKLFFDIGTYSDLWSDVPPAGRFLYDAGIQVSLFRSLVNVYIPVLYSKVYKDRYSAISNGQSYFWKTVSFNINLSALQPRNSNFLWPQ